jgi:aminoglycoside 6'-N-acetyltransferase
MRDASFERIGTERLVVRRFAEADAGPLVAYRNDPEVARYQGWETPYAIAEARRFISALGELDPGMPGEWFQFAVGLAPDGRLIGDCALRCDPADPRQAELGCSFARSHQRHGYAVEAVGAVLEYGFTVLSLRRIFAYTDLRNAPARRLLDRLRFRQEGELRESAGAGREPETELLYEKLEREWRQSAQETQTVV